MSKSQIPNSQSAIPNPKSPPRCPACGGARLTPFYEMHGAPAHSVLLMPTREAALTYPRGDIHLALCEACGFITNTAFDPTLHEYSERYEETQGFSPTFSAFHRALAQRLIQRYDLHHKTILEIGCGKGEFLTLLCQMGDNRGVGFDPAYIPERNQATDERLTFIRDFYSEQYADYQADFIVCKMTLEHIPDVGDFVAMVRRAIGDRRETVVFFQIPEIRRILRDLEFVDVYYEHCSYFSPGSLARLFRRAGFDVIDLWTDYGDQYLMIEARPGDGDSAPLPQEESLEALRQDVAYFAENVPAELARWRQILADLHARGQRAVLWGGGSKAVAFLTTLGNSDAIEYVVDINPYKQGYFLPGTGQEVVGPAFLQEYRPQVVIIMNPVYEAEITRSLAEMGLHPKILLV